MGRPRVGRNFVFAPTCVPSSLIIHLQNQIVLEAAFVKSPGGAQTRNTTSNDHNGHFHCFLWCRKRLAIAQQVPSSERFVHEGPAYPFAGLERQANQRGTPGREEPAAVYPQ